MDDRNFEIEEILELRRRRFMTLIERIGELWRDVFNQNPNYVGSVTWSLFTRLWKSEKNTVVSYSDAMTFMPELRSAAGARSYIERAIADGYLEHVSEGIRIPNSRKDRPDRVLDGIRLTISTRAAIDRCFADAATEIDTIAEGMPRLP